MATHTTRWLVYLRFDVGAAVETYHVAVISKDRTPLVVARAQQRGPSPGARLVEYAVFGSLRSSSSAPAASRRAAAAGARWPRRPCLTASRGGVPLVRSADP